MPSQYILKKPVLDANRLQKVAKKLIDEATEDRKLALDTMKYFRDMVDENGTDSTAKNLIVDCLKLAQSSKDKTIRILDLLVKLDKQSAPEADLSKSSGKPNQSVFSVLNELTE
tara:strand:+ start:76 stop:417 length:342 start_codon:yes stop_codon:yes gene_type:complete